MSAYILPFQCKNNAICSDPEMPIAQKNCLFHFDRWLSYVQVIYENKIISKSMIFGEMVLLLRHWCPPYTTENASNFDIMERAKSLYKSHRYSESLDAYRQENNLDCYNLALKRFFYSLISFHLIFSLCASQVREYQESEVCALESIRLHPTSKVFNQFQSKVDMSSFIEGILCTCEIPPHSIEA